MRRLFLAACLLASLAIGTHAQGTTQYPTSLDTSTTLPQAVDQKFTYLTAATTNSATTITVNSTAGVPTSGVLQIDSEFLSYTTASGTTFTVARAFSGTTAAAHASAATVRFPLTSAHINGLRGGLFSLEAKLGITGSGGTATPTTPNDVLTVTAAGASMWKPPTGGGTGTVTSVGLSTPGVFYSVSGSPVTTSGTLALNLISQSANCVFAGPTSGGAAAPSCRSLVVADLPAHTHAFTDMTGTATNAQLPGTLSSKTFDNTNTANFKGSLFTLQDATDTTKQARFDLSNIATATTRTVNIPNANSTTVQSSSAGSNQFATGVSAQGVFSYAQPSFSNVSGSVAAAQMPALTGDVTTSAGAVATTLASVGTAGTYRSVTTDAKGRVTAGTSPTTFSGYGLSDTSANLRAVLTDETGTGTAFFAGGDIGSATGTSLNLSGSITSTAPSYTAPSLLNSWANLGSPYATAGYLKQAGVVHLRGTVTGGTIGTNLFQLPAGYRPAATIIFACNSVGGVGILSIDSTGNVNAGAGSSGSFSLDCVQFVP